MVYDAAMTVIMSRGSMCEKQLDGATNSQKLNNV